MKQRTLVLLTLGYALGIIFAWRWSLPAAGWLAAVVGALLWWFASGQGHGDRLGWILILAFFLLGGWHYQLRQQSQLAQWAALPVNQDITVTGKILSPPGVYSNRTTYDLALPTRTKVQLVIRGERTSPHWSPGDRVTVTGHLASAQIARNPGEFNYRDYLWRQGILAELTASREAVTLSQVAGPNWRGLIMQAKFAFQDLLQENISAQGSGVVRALLFGDKTALEGDLKDAFMVLGIMHLLAVSGLHVGFLLLLVHLMRRLLKLNPRQGFWLTVILLFCYAALTDFTPSVLRASLMAVFFLWGGLLQQEKDFYTGVALAGLILLIYNPFYLFQSGFQLSFLSAWGIIYFRPLIGKLLPEAWIWRETVMIPLAAQIAVLPAVAYYFNLLSLAGFVVNILLVPVAGLLVIGGLVAFIISLFFSGLAAIFLIPLGVIVDGLLGVFVPWASFPWSAVSVATPTPFFLIIYYALALGIRELVMGEEWRKKLAAQHKPVLVIGAIILVLGIGGQKFHSRPLEVVFLDVGQGDAIVIRSPQGKTILLDGGGAPAWQAGGFRVGQEVVIPYLIRQGIGRPDLLISSHPDGDHLQGLAEVAASLGAKAILWPPPAIFAGEYDSFDQLAQARGIPTEAVVAGDIIYWEEGLTLEVLNPPRNEKTFDSAPDNNHSLLIRVVYGEASFLLTGDIEIEALAALAAASSVGPATVFKAPHHGSKTGMHLPYLDQLEPLAVVLSVGSNNYGHPAPELLSYWEGRKVPIYRTDLQGAIIMRTDGKSIKIIPFIKAEGSQPGGRN